LAVSAISVNSFEESCKGSTLVGYFLGWSSPHDSLWTEPELLGGQYW